MRIVRRIIRRHRGVGGFGREVPHERGYALPLAELAPEDAAALALAEEAARGGDASAPVMVLVLAEGEDLARRRMALGIYAAWEVLQRSGAPGDEATQTRIARVGEVAWREIQGLLRARHWLLPARPGEPADRVTWSLFAAYWVELRVFEPHLLAVDLPSLARRCNEIDALLAADVPWPIPSEPSPAVPLLEDLPPTAEDVALGARLEALTGVVGPWSAALASLGRASRPSRNDRRLRLDLDKTCFESERTSERTDLLAWFASLGRHPLRRALPQLSLVRTVRHLARAHHRIALAGLAPTDAERLEALVGAALHAAETRLRAALRPALVAATLPAVGHVTVVESVAHDKLVDELLDRLVARHRLDFPALRDGVSRNQAKLADLGASGVLRDPLLVSDRALSRALPGVHRRGEVYRRGLHRLSALLFGTPVGRATTRWLLIPALGAYGALELLQHTLLFVVEALAEVELPIVTPAVFAVTAAFIFGLVNVPVFRRAVGTGLRTLGRGLRTVFVAWPRWLVMRPWLRAFFASRAVRVLLRVLFAPALLAAPLAVPIALGLFDLPPPARAFVALGLLVASAVVINTPLGARLAEAATDTLVATRRAITQRFLPALLGWILAFFRALLDGLERLIYAVDERLRTRVGDRRRRAVAVAVLALPWRALAYLLRLYVNVSLEPKVNPVKHFPAVTIGHKVVLPLSFAMDHALEAPLGPSAAHILATSMLFIVPGLFGFLAWEVKENWRLYAANRPRLLRAAVIGSHGETMERLLRRGLHSGTLPKLFAKHRRIARRPRNRLRVRRLHALDEKRAHVLLDIERFAERELVALLARAGCAIAVRDVEVATQRVRIVLAGRSPQAPETPERTWQLTFEDRPAGLYGALVPPADATRDSPAFVLAARGALPLAGVPPLPGSDLPLTWDAWTEAWETVPGGARFDPRAAFKMAAKSKSLPG